jgi:hypothetical protein
MSNKILFIFVLVSLFELVGCVSIPLAPTEQDAARKQFPMPAQDTAGVYIYRNHLATRQGLLVKRSIYMDDKLLGDTLPDTYFFREVKPGIHKISTESEFSNNDLTLDAEAGKNYFVHQFLKMGLLSAATGIELVPEDVGKKGVLNSQLAQ